MYKEVVVCSYLDETIDTCLCVQFQDAGLFSYLAFGHGQKWIARHNVVVEELAKKSIPYISMDLLQWV